MSTEIERLEKDKDRILETIKFWQDTFKHLTTLCSGAIVVLAAFLDKSGNPPKLWLVGTTFALLIICIISSAIALVFLSKAHMRIAIGGEVTTNLLKLVFNCELVSILSFILALTALTIFVIERY
jgi:hypothetical protein